jgi:drug/metabolite transporter (DMT)-like permease
LLFAALGVIWGIPYLLIKVAVSEITPACLVFMRTTIGATLLLPLVRREHLRPLLDHWRPILLFTIVEMAIPWVLLSDAERRVTSSLAGLFMAAVPLVGALLARVSGNHDPLRGKQIGGLALGLSGVVALLGLDVGRGDPAAIVELAVVAFGYALGPLIVSRRLSDLPTSEVVAVSLALCAVGYAPIGIAQLPSALPRLEVVAAVIVLGAVCTAGAFLLFFRLIAEVGPVRSTVITYVNPAVAVVAGVALLGEPFTAGTAVGFVLILAGSWLATGPSAQAAAAAPRTASAG